MWVKWKILLLLSLLILITHIRESVAGKRVRSQNERLNEMGSRALGYRKKKTTPKPVYKWRPNEDSELALAKQKGIPEQRIPENDPEFEFVWPDDYYDDYDFEHVRNQIQHGNWEAKTQNYHATQLKRAKEAAKKERELAAA